MRKVKDPGVFVPFVHDFARSQRRLRASGGRLVICVGADGLAAFLTWAWEQAPDDGDGEIRVIRVRGINDPAPAGLRGDLNLAGMEVVYDEARTDWNFDVLSAPPLAETPEGRPDGP